MRGIFGEFQINKMKKTLSSRPRTAYQSLKLLPTPKSLATILLGTSLFFGTVNKTDGQIKEDVEFYNLDKDTFPEEILVYIREGFNEKRQKYNKKNMGLTILYYSDNNNDDFHENLRVYNCNNMNCVSIEDFYVKKNTEKVDYSWKIYWIDKNLFREIYEKKPFLQIATENFPYKKYLRREDNLNDLTKDEIKELWPGYFGFDERVKRLVNAGKNPSELKKIVRYERSIWKYSY